MPAKKEMPYSTSPCLKDISYRGFIEGLTYQDNESKKDACHYFGGLPYALPPVGPFRWRKPRALPACYRYGTRSNPGRFSGGAALCPQPGFMGPPNTELFDEDCLQLNIWVPAEEPPAAGWPVFFFIHGGWLQFGSPNGSNCIAMLAESPVTAIVVCPAYRLNLFGFLASREFQEEAEANGEHVGNFGFWDQRLALEWTYTNISYFGGDPKNITVGGYSAGSHSTFHQLSHDLFVPKPSKRIIKRVAMFSNGSGIAPKSLTDAQAQFDELLSALSIPPTLSSRDKLARLRSLPPDSLLAAISSMKHHEFRSWTDGAFVRTNLFGDIESGAYARRMRDRGTQLLMGECSEEHFLYGIWRPPKADSRAATVARLEADYPAPVVQALLDRFYSPDGKLPTWQVCEDWCDAFGRIYADLQVYAMERGFVEHLIKGGAGDLLHRYRVEWRAKCVELPVEWGVTHSTDIAIWFWGNGSEKGLEKGEKTVVKAWLEPFARYLEGGKVEWGADASKGEIRRLTAQGDVDILKDGDTERASMVFHIAREAQKKTYRKEDETASKL